MSQHSRRNVALMGMLMKPLLFVLVCVTVFTIIQSKRHSPGHDSKVHQIKQRLHNVQPGQVKPCGYRCRETKCIQKCSHYRMPGKRRRCHIRCMHLSNKAANVIIRSNNVCCGDHCMAIKQLRNCRIDCRNNLSFQSSWRTCRRKCYRSYMKKLKELRGKCGPQCKVLIRKCKNGCQWHGLRSQRITCKGQCEKKYRFKDPRKKKCSNICRARKALKACKKGCFNHKIFSMMNACRRRCFKRYRNAVYIGGNKRRCTKNCSARRVLRKCKRSCWSFSNYKDRQICRRKCIRGFKKVLIKMKSVCNKKCEIVKKFRQCMKRCKKFKLSWNRGRCYDRCSINYRKSYKQLKAKKKCDFHCQEWKRLKKCELFCKIKSRNKARCISTCFIGYHRRLMNAKKSFCGHRCLIRKQYQACHSKCNSKKMIWTNRRICKNNCYIKYKGMLTCGPKCKKLENCQRNCRRDLTGSRKMLCERGCYISFEQPKTKAKCGLRCMQIVRLCHPRCKHDRMCFRRCAKRFILRHRTMKKKNAYMVVAVIHRRQKGQKLAYACSLHHGHKLTTRGCPAIGTRKGTCDGDKLTVIFEGAPAVLTFCNYKDKLLQPSYVSIAVNKSCSPSLNRKHRRCFNGWKCEGGPVGVVYNDKAMSLMFCKKKGAKFDPMELFGPTFFSKKTVYVKTAPVAQMPTVNVP